MNGKNFNQIKEVLRSQLGKGDDYTLTHPEVIILAVLTFTAGRAEEESYTAGQIRELVDIGNEYRRRYEEKKRHE